MTLHNHRHSFDEVKWMENQLKRYGPIIGGEVLRTFLGFRTYAAFDKARRLSTLNVTIFGLPGRQGHFALTDEACALLIDQRKAARAGINGTQNSGVARETNEEMLL